jgi:hypothetical protein
MQNAKDRVNCPEKTPNFKTPNFRKKFKFQTPNPPTDPKPGQTRGFTMTSLVVLTRPLRAFSGVCKTAVLCWKAARPRRTPKPVGISEACGERASVWSAKRQLRFVRELAVVAILVDSVSQRWLQSLIRRRLSPRGISPILPSLRQQWPLFQPGSNAFCSFFWDLVQAPPGLSLWPIVLLPPPRCAPSLRRKFSGVFFPFLNLIATGYPHPLEVLLPQLHRFGHLVLQFVL